MQISNQLINLFGEFIAKYLPPDKMFTIPKFRTVLFFITVLQFLLPQ